MSFTPPPRPVFVDRLIAMGESVGGPEQLVSLAPDDLLAAATRSTGLEDFGEDGWRTHFEVLVRALEEESKLHLVGRTLVRTELVQTLRNRLRLTELWSRHGDLFDVPVEAPVFIVGSARSGTSILQELLDCDPATRTPAMWEMHHPVEAFEGVDRGEVCDRVMKLWHDLQPEYETMHANSGHLGNECIFITLHEFLSDHWGGNHCVPSYDAHLQAADHHPAYAFHRRFLQTLQRGERQRWLLKAPSHLFTLRTLFDAYPDARIIRTHRDPLRSLGSMVSIMGTLKWMRCREVDLSGVPQALAAGHAYLYQREMRDREQGKLPDDQFVDVRFEDLVREPVKTVTSIHERLGWPIPDGFGEGVSRYVAAKPKGSKGAHQYSLEGIGLDPENERERFRFYTRHYGIREEKGL